MILRPLALALCFATTALALFQTGGYTLTGPFTNNEREGVTVTGGLTLQGPADNLTFSALDWYITGGIKLPTAGNYVVHGPITLTGGITGPATGSATIQFTGSRFITGTIASNVRVLQPGEAPPPAEPPPSSSGNSSAPLINISTRATLAAGQALMPGFVVGGSTQRRVLIRAIGPTLSRFGVSAPMARPALKVFTGQTQIASNSGWGGSTDTAAVFQKVGAFDLPSTSADCALLLTLSPGSYTADIRGDTAGEVLLEVYFVD